MGKSYRSIDANINRVSEGIRVLEDISRFDMDHMALSADLKHLRHTVRKLAKPFENALISQRNSPEDVGADISATSKVDDKKTAAELIAANFKRVQEGLRVIEEHLKIVDQYDISKAYERLRFTSYELEKRFYMAFNENTVKKSLPDTDLYCLTSEAHSNGRNNIDVVKEMIESGVKIIQYREKEKSMLEKYRECQTIRQMTKASGVTFIINDNVDLAILSEADGIHIGQDDLPIEEVRKLTDGKMFIGISTHSAEQAEEAVRRGADYIGVGPIFKTYTKKDVCDPVGFDYLDYVVKNITLPFVAIGGIKATNIKDVRAHGARCIAMVTEIVGAENIREKINQLRSEV